MRADVISDSRYMLALLFNIMEVSVLSVIIVNELFWVEFA